MLASSSRVRRWRDLGSKAWSYGIGLLEHPVRAPATLIAVARGAHLGEMLKLRNQSGWLRQSDIRTVIDVGAHSGQFASSLRQFLPAAQIYAFEPIIECHDKLTRRFSDDPFFKAFRVALGASDGNVPFYASSFPKASSPLVMSALHKRAFPWSADTFESIVPLRRLDGYRARLRLTPNVLLKIDVQGYEYEVLLGATGILEEISYVLVELSFSELYEGQSDFHNVYRFLADRGFAYAGSWDQLTSPLDHAILQADSLFVRAT